MRGAAIAGLALAASIACAAQPESAPRVAAGSPPGSGACAPGESHAWVLLDSPTVDGYVLLHVPPRGLDAPGGASEVGTARHAKSLTEHPAFIAAWGREAFMVFEPGKPIPREVLRVRAGPLGVAGMWRIEPDEGAESIASIPEGGDLLDVTGSAAGLAALVRRDGRLTVSTLVDRYWVEEPAPGGPDRARLLASADRLGIFTLDGLDAGVIRWRGTEGWSEQRVALPEGWDAPPDAGVWWTPAGVVASRRVEDMLEIWACMPDDAAFIARTSLAGGWGHAIAPSMSNGTLVVAWNERFEGRSVRGGVRWALAEISTQTGRELYRGSPKSGSPLSDADLRVLAIAMLVLMAGLVAFLLRPGPEGAAPVLPEGCSLAPPGRRLAASVVDFFFIAIVVSRLMHLPLVEVLSVVRLLGSMHGAIGLVLLVVLGTTLGTFFEWASGRTPGKLLLGCRVVSVRPASPRPGLLRCVARNSFKWLFAPLALMEMTGGVLRHRGDLAAGLAVVVRERTTAAQGGPTDGERPSGTP